MTCGTDIIIKNVLPFLQMLVRSLSSMSMKMMRILSAAFEFRSKSTAYVIITCSVTRTQHCPEQSVDDVFCDQSEFSIDHFVRPRGHFAGCRVKELLLWHNKRASNARASLRDVQVERPYSKLMYSRKNLSHERYILQTQLLYTFERRYRKIN